VSRRPVRLAGVLAVAPLGLSVLSACGTGLNARTYAEIGRQDGAHANVAGLGGVAVRNVYVEPAATGTSLDAGGTAYVTGSLVNNGSTPDQLLSATTDAASSVTLLQDGGETTSVPIPPLALAPAGWELRLDNLTHPVLPGTYITVTLVFAHAGHIDLQVPARAGDQGLTDRTPAQDPYAEK
jgi:copper(I)-binding protein